MDQAPRQPREGALELCLVTVYTFRRWPIPPIGADFYTPMQRHSKTKLGYEVDQGFRF
jgi:hypothetical protein